MRRFPELSSEATGIALKRHAHPLCSDIVFGTHHNLETKSLMNVLCYCMKRGRYLVALLLGLAVSNAPTWASAEVLYSTSYEAPDYSVGAVSGQDGWDNSFGFDPVVTSGFGRTGSQSLEVRQPAGKDPFGLTFRTGPYSTAAPMVSVEHSIYLDGPDGWASPSTFLSPMALIGENGFVSQLAVRDGNRIEFGGEVVGIETSSWIGLNMVLNFQTQTSSAFVNGTFLGSEDFANPAAELTQVEIFTIFDNTNFNAPGPSSSFFLDDLSITAVPEPSSVGILAFAAVGFIALRLRRLKKA